MLLGVFAQIMHSIAAKAMRVRKYGGRRGNFALTAMLSLNVTLFHYQVDLHEENIICGIENIDRETASRGCTSQIV